MMPCAIHNIPMGGRGDQVEATHLVCSKCEEEINTLRAENGRLRNVIKEIYTYCPDSEMKLDTTMDFLERIHVLAREALAEGK